MLNHVTGITDKDYEKPSILSGGNPMKLDKIESMVINWFIKAGDKLGAKRLVAKFKRNRLEGNK